METRAGDIMETRAGDNLETRAGDNLETRAGDNTRTRSDDKSLVELSISGDAGAFEELVTRYEKRIVAAAIRLCSNREEGEDMAQEAFIKAWRALAGYRGQASFGTWMMAILTNIWRDRLRKTQLPADSMDALTQVEDGETRKQYRDESPGPAAISESLETKEVLGGMLSELKPEFREALVLRDIQGFSYEEVAVITGVNLGTVKSRINRGRTALKERIIDYQEQNPGFFRLSELKKDKPQSPESGFDQKGGRSEKGGEPREF